MATLHHLLEESARRFGTKTALRIRRSDGLEQWSYQHLYEFSERLALHLNDCGIGKGECVLVCAPNMPEWVALYFGCMRAGVILVPLDEGCAPDFVHSVNEQTAARCVFTSHTLRGRLPELGIPVRFLEDLPGEVEGVGEARESSLPYPDEEDIAEVMFTSGTTGDPKGVVLTHRNIVSNVEAATQIVPTRPSYRLLSLLPLSHMFEQTVGLLAPLKGGATVVYPASRQPRILFQTLRDERITTMALVPQAISLFWSAIEREVRAQGKEGMWNRMLALSAYLPMRWRRLLFRPIHRQLGGCMDFFMCGGAHLDSALARNWELLGIAVLQGYGTTEASPIVTTNSMKDRTPDSVGKSLPGQAVKIAPDGEVLIKGANVTKGYWGNPKATKAAFEDGWYRTGDLGYLDEQGRLYLRGRKKDMIALDNGMNVYAQDVEEALKGHAGVEDACVVGLPRNGGQIRVHAVLLLKEEGINAEVVVSQTNQRLAEHQRVRGITVWPFDDFPRTHTLKVKKHEVMAYLTCGTTPKTAEDT